MTSKPGLVYDFRSRTYGCHACGTVLISELEAAIGGEDSASRVLAEHQCEAIEFGRFVYGADGVVGVALTSGGNTGDDVIISMGPTAVVDRKPPEQPKPLSTEKVKRRIIRPAR